MNDEIFNILSKVTEEEIRQYAENNSRTIMIREYHNSHGCDYDRLATEEESHTIQSIIRGALFSIKYGSAYFTVDFVHHVADTAEFIATGLLPNANNYNTIYIPILNWCKEKGLPW